MFTTKRSRRFGIVSLRRETLKLFKTTALLAIAFLAATSVPVSTVGAAEITLMNDSTPAPASGTPLPNFIPNDQAAAWLTTPVAGDIVGVQVFWASQFGGQPQSLELAIHIYAPGTFPTPGSLLASVAAPQLIDGSVNEFRYLDPPANNVPLKLLVSANQTFVVALEFLNQNSGNPFAPSVVYDADGCQSGKNAVFTMPGGWFNACLLGVSGDFGIRAIIDPLPDADGDLVPDLYDNCPDDWNPSQTDTDGDGVGDACDILPGCNDKANLYPDNIINLSDYALLAADYGCTSGCLADIDGDGDTDIVDVSIVAANWLCTD